MVKIQTILDTNIIFAGLYSEFGASFQVLRALTARKIQPVLSVALLFEYEDILKRNSRKLGLTYRDIDAFLGNLFAFSSYQKIHCIAGILIPSLLMITYPSSAGSIEGVGDVNDLVKT